MGSGILFPGVSAAQKDIVVSQKERETYSGSFAIRFAGQMEKDGGSLEENMEYTIRRAQREDGKEAAKVEAACFPAAEAAPEEIFRQRLEAFEHSFFIAKLPGGRVIGLINGAVTDERTIRDEMFSDVSLHNEEGNYQSIFGLCVLPEFQKKGVASALMRRMVREAAGRKKQGVILTCKEGLIPYYSKFGFRNQGVSNSTHGAAVWYDMILELGGERNLIQAQRQAGAKL